MRDALGNMRRVLVLGGDSDIGNAIAAEAVRQRGVDHVILAARDPERLTDRVDQLTSLGAQVDTVAFDLTDYDAHGLLFERLASQYGDLDLVVLAAAILGDQHRAEHDPAHLREMLEVDFVAAAGVGMAAARALEAQGTGTLLVLSTIAALQARRTNFVYGAAKAGLDAFAQGLSDMVDGSGARVLVVRPGFVHSKMTTGLDEAPFAQTPNEVAAAAIAALGRSRTVVHTSGPVAAVGKVLQALPRPAVRKLPR